MWFLKFWIISSIACYLVITIYSEAMVCRLKREYIFSKNNMKLIEKVLAQLKTIIISCVPIINIGVALVFVLNEKGIYEKAIEEGKYQKKENNP